MFCLLHLVLSICPMSNFSLFFQLGAEHILDVNGIDHILFVIVLCCIYDFKMWKQVLILVTAFTMGHSVTLGLSAINVINLNSGLVELLIPVTILVTAISNIISGTTNFKPVLNYCYALFFGLIHGLGFSNYLKGLLGKESSVIAELLGFNIGLEVGQLIIVACFAAISFALIRILNLQRKHINFTISSAIAVFCIFLISSNSVFQL